jgi:hypothetical protein
LSLRFAPKADMPLRGSECSLWATSRHPTNKNPGADRAIADYNEAIRLDPKKRRPLQRAGQRVRH